MTHVMRHAVVRAPATARDRDVEGSMSKLWFVSCGPCGPSCRCGGGMAHRQLVWTSHLPLSGQTGLQGRTRVPPARGRAPIMWSIERSSDDGAARGGIWAFKAHRVPDRI